MNILELVPTVYDKLIIYILVLTRISALFSTFVFFRRDYINPRTLISLAAILSFYVIILNPVPAYRYNLFSIHMLMDSLFQFLIGFLAGLLLNLVFEIFTAFGQIVSTQIGIGLASVIDPKLGMITNLTHFYMFSAIIIFLSMNGHLYLIKLIVNSFVIMPIGHSYMPTQLLASVVQYSSVIFTGSIMLSLTIIFAILLTNFTLAVLTRFAPQFNLFSVGVNLSLVIGILCIYLTLPIVINKGNAFIQDGLRFLTKNMLLRDCAGSSICKVDS